MNKTFSIGYNADIGGGFTGFAGQHCGFHIGVGLGLFNVKVKVGDLENFTPNKTDANGYDFDLYTTLSGYSETHKTLSLTVPLMFQFQTKMKPVRNLEKNHKQCFYAMTGAKLQMLFNRSYNAEITTLYNAAWYHEAHNWAATQTFAGLGDFVGKDANEKFGIGFLAMFTFETGMKWKLREHLNLYAGVYFDCGLNDPTKDHRKPVSDYTEVEHLAGLSLLSFYNKSILMGTGIKLRVAFTKPPKREVCPETANEKKNKTSKKLECPKTE